MIAVVSRSAHGPIFRARVASTRTAGGSYSALPAWLVLVGAIIPAAQVQLYVGGAKFTAGRIGILLLLVPALIRLFQKDRHGLASDFFVCIVAGWMFAAAYYTSGMDAISSTAAETLEFLGGYIVARAFFFGPDATYTFTRVLKRVIACIVLLALADNLSGHLIVQEKFSAVFGGFAPLAPDYRWYWVRAAATFDHPILLGAFCATACCIFLFSERRQSSKLFWAGLSLFGCLLALSSAPLLSCSITLALYVYNALLKRYGWRWHALNLLLGVAVVVILSVANHPLGWIVSHLTFDPVSGYFRMLIWDAAIPRILDAPFAGHAFSSLQDDILDTTVDAAWLVFALRFGIPMIFFLALSNIASFLPVRSNFRGTIEDTRLSDLRTGFTIAVAMLMFTGLTVHYWNYMWIFWGVCIGIRSSLREFSIYQSRVMGERLELAPAGRPIAQTP
ncbi:hypothetical protein [Bradyrhizobium vignae]|uniref:hypothetical protein n=1 Tax=Bradyrhizobium vignae TaxID=1549949 RepID=UPI00100BF514|nr:hypothetical protein [Bradyrhizobium vignae]RXG91473.1 hypothetical protein EAV90_27970 [Bradyrhizobium vignae]